MNHPFLCIFCLALMALFPLHAAENPSPNMDLPRDMAGLRREAESGNPYAQCVLGYRFAERNWEQSSDGELHRLLQPNMPEAVRWFKLSAEQNWAGGQMYLGLCYIEGNGVEQDEEKGLELVRKAADQNQVYAMFELAKLYTRGIGEPRSDSDRPIQLLECVVTAGMNSTRRLTDAYEMLVLRYEYGIGTERDNLTAAQWHCRAALAGLDGSSDQFSLADPEAPPTRPHYVSYTGEVGLPGISVVIPDTPRRSADFRAMLALYLKAAHGDANAAIQIGNARLKGTGIPPNPQKAWTWFSLAASNGATNVQDTISRCESAMSADELKTAKEKFPNTLQHIRKVGIAAER